MRSRFIMMIAMLVTTFSWGQSTIRGDAFVLEDQRVWLSMVHTPNGHVLQQAPYTEPFYAHLNIGAGFIVNQAITTIDVAIEDGTFFENPGKEEEHSGTSGMGNNLINATGERLQIHAEYP